MGSTFVSPAGVLRVDSIEIDQNATPDDLRGSPDDPVFRIGLSYVGPDPRQALAADTTLDPSTVDDLSTRLSRLDQRSSHGPWTGPTLALIATYPGLRAAELAEMLGREKQQLKLDIRKLKNLGLTLSLKIGYEISPRGRAFLEAQENRPSPQ